MRTSDYMMPKQVAIVANRATMMIDLLWQWVQAWFREPPRVLLDGLQLAEGPRWRNGRLVFSDMHAGEVVALKLDGSRQTLAKLPDGCHCSGLGFLVDGSILVVSMQERSVLRLSAATGQLQLWADLSALPGTYMCNDMLVDDRGRAYIGNYGWDIHDTSLEPRSTTLALATASAPPRAVAEDVLFPNGMVVLEQPCGARVLIVAETWGLRLTAFDIADDGSLSNRRVWATLLFPPDGLCADAEGCIWVANPMKPGFAARVGEGGKIHRIIRSDRKVLAVALGGPDGKTLFLCECDEVDPKLTRPGNSRVRAVQVPVGAAVR